MDIINKINKSKNFWEILPKLSTEDIEKVLKISADSYYNTSVSLITDDVYDALKDRLQMLKPSSKILKKVGAPVRGRKIKLPIWLGSMDKIKSDNAPINKWTQTRRGPYLVSDKLDGISCLLELTDGKINLYTRGDGTFGQRITFLIDLINIPYQNLYEHKNSNILIRGELIMTKNNFKKYESFMSNARNMVAGLVNSKFESINKEYAADVDFISYEVIEPKLKPSDQMKQLKKWKMPIVYYDIYQKINFEILDSLLQKRKMKSIYEIDGIIITDDHKHTYPKSGNPSYSFAYKGMTPTADVKVIDVEWKPSKDGYLVPRIHFEKVRLSQADLEYATGFNAKFIKDNKIGPGAIIRVIRSGEVIPYVIGVVKPAKKPALPENVDYEWDKNGVNIILINAEDDQTVIIQRLTRFMHKLGVENISEGIITRLVEAGYDNIPKIMSLTVDDFLSLEGFKETLANKLYNNLNDKLNQLDVLKLMVASNLFGRGFGSKKLRKILDVYPNIVNEFSSSTKKEWINKLMALEGFDTITVNKFLEALPEFQQFYKMIKKIRSIKPHLSKIKKAGLFKNQVVVFTGFRYKDWENFIETEGGRIAGSVSGKTTLIIFSDQEKQSSKLGKAKKLGIKTISKSEFAKKYGI